MLRDMSKVLTVSSEDPELDPTNKYTLRGVVTSPDVVYMCRRRATEPFETENAGDKTDQWWRVFWVASDDNPVKQEATTFEKVQEAIFTEVDTDGSKAPILVYATDRALNEEPAPVSGALQVSLDPTYLHRDALRSDSVSFQPTDSVPGSLCILTDAE